MMRRVPVFSTLIVAAAIAVMIALGVWQIGRMHEKEALLERYRAARTMPAEAPFGPDSLYRRSRLDCPRPTAASTMAGLNRNGESGQAHVVRCSLAGGGEALVVLGWSRDVAAREWRGGEVVGWVAPGPRLVADPPLAGLEANAVPDPSSIPNNHWSYAVQWFLFAGVALVIYALAVRKRLAAGARPG